MRAMFSVVGLLAVVVIIGFLAKKQFSSMAGPPALPAPPGAPAAAANAPPATPKQTVDAFKNAVEGQMQQARPMPDDPK